MKWFINTKKNVFLFGIIAVYFILTFFLLRGVLFQEGVPLTRDLVFPYNISLSYGSSTYTWDDLHSQRSLEINKIPVFYLLSQLSNIIGSELTTKLILFLTMFSVPSIISITLFLVFRHRVQSISMLGVICALPSMYYLFNPVVVDRISNHIFMVLGIALNPPILFLFLQVIQTKKIMTLRLFCLILLLTASSMMSTHNIFYMFPILGFLGLFYIFIKHSLKKKRTILNFVSILGLYLLVNSYWIYPLASVYAGSGISPSYSLVVEEILRISEFNTPANVFQLIGGGGWKAVLEYSNLNQNMVNLSLFLSFIVPTFSLLALVLYRRSTLVLALGCVFLLVYFLSLGFNSPIPLYSWLFSTAPFSSFAWIYRDPTRLLIYLLLIYSLFLSFSLYKVLQQRQKRISEIKPTIVLVVTASIILSPSFFTFMNQAGSRLISSTVPVGYEQVYNFLSSDPSSYKVLWLPMKQYYNYDWNKVTDEVAGDFYFVSSPKETYGFTTQSSVLGSKLWEYLNSNIITEYRSDHLGLLLNTFNVKYLVVHDDLLGPQKAETSKIIKILNLQKDISLEQKIGSYYLYLNNAYDSSKEGFYTIPLDLYRKVQSLESYEIEPISVSLRVEDAEWVTSGHSVSEHSISFEDGINLENYDKLVFNIYADTNNDDRSLSISVFGESIPFTVDRNITMGKWNNIEVDLRGAKIGTANTTNYFNPKNLTEILIAANGNNSFVIKDLMFSSRRDDLANYDSIRFLDLWNIPINQTSHINYSKLSPVNYVVTLTSYVPTVLTFVEGYDQNWRAFYSNENGSKVEIGSSPAFSAINAFVINEPGIHNIEIIYSTSELVNIGTIISIVSTLSLGSYFMAKKVYLVRNKDRGIKKNQ